MCSRHRWRVHRPPQASVARTEANAGSQLRRRRRRGPESWPGALDRRSGTPPAQTPLRTPLDRRLYRARAQTTRRGSACKATRMASHRGRAGWDPRRHSISVSSRRRVDLRRPLDLCPRCSPTDVSVSTASNGGGRSTRQTRDSIKAVLTAAGVLGELMMLCPGSGTVGCEGGVRLRKGVSLSNPGDASQSRRFRRLRRRGAPHADARYRGATSDATAAEPDSHPSRNEADRNEGRTRTSGTGEETGNGILTS